MVAPMVAPKRHEDPTGYPVGPSQVPRTGLEPASPKEGASTSSWCVCQFRHLGVALGALRSGSLERTGRLTRGGEVRSSKRLVRFELERRAELDFAPPADEQPDAPAEPAELI